jgi:hypothetical protein
VYRRWVYKNGSLKNDWLGTDGFLTNLSLCLTVRFDSGPQVLLAVNFYIALINAEVSLAQQSKFFFNETKIVSEELGSMFSFTWASYLGLRELWWQTRGYARVHPELTPVQIEKKFTGGLPLPGGIDFKELFLEMEWEEHERRIAKSMLFEACTMYEQWLEAVCDEMGLPASRAKTIADQLQFPLGHAPNGKVSDYQVALDYIKLHRSAFMESQFVPNLRGNKLNCRHQLSDYIGAYRFFKECRNSLIHSGGLANGRIEAYHLGLVQAQTFPRIPYVRTFNHDFSLAASREGERIPLSVQDCKLFATIVQRVIVTLDAELALYNGCENIVKKRTLPLATATKGRWIDLIGSNTKKQAARTKGLLSSTGLPIPVDAHQVYLWLKVHHIVA